MRLFHVVVAVVTSLGSKKNVLHSQPDYHFLILPIKSLISDADVVVLISLSRWQVVGDSVPYTQEHLWL